MYAGDRVWVDQFTHEDVIGIQKVILFEDARYDADLLAGRLGICPASLFRDCPQYRFYLVPAVEDVCVLEIVYLIIPVPGREGRGLRQKASQHNLFSSQNFVC